MVIPARDPVSTGVEFCSQSGRCVDFLAHRMFTMQ